MKLLVIICIFFLTSSAHANSALQLGFGGLTPHFSSNKKNYCNQWNNTGIIVNKSYYVRYMFQDIGFTYMQGNDSICSEIEGVFLHYIFDRTDYIETGVTFGGYAFNQTNWDGHARSTPESIDAPQPVQTKYFGRDIVPVLALDIAVHLIRRDNWSFKLNNLITPVIFNHSVAFEYRF